jgi:hypothetical protein
LAAIDHYPNPQNNLPSCLADARAFERVLTGTFGFTETRMLLDSDATLASVEAGLDWLFAGAAADDRLVFYYSGHGYQARRGDSLDEVLCLYDQFLFDDALSQRTQALPPGVFTLISDSCHSGGMYKIMAGVDGMDSVQVAQTKVLRVPPQELVDKVFVNPADVRTLRYRPFGARPGSLAAIGKKFNMAMPKGFDEQGQLAMNGLLLSACLENETASASTPRTDGKSAFTYALISQLTALGPEASNRRLMDAVTQSLQQMGFRQTPVLMEPVAPPGMGELAFLTLGQPKAAVGSLAGGFPMAEADLARLVREAIARIQGGGSATAPSAQPTAAGATLR